jgi:hypothetical protein
MLSISYLLYHAIQKSPELGGEFPVTNTIFALMTNGCTLLTSDRMFVLLKPKPYSSDVRVQVSELHAEGQR